MLPKIELRILIAIFLLIAWVISSTSKELREAAYTFSQTCGNVKSRLDTLEQANAAQEEAISDLSTRDNEINLP